MKKPAATIYLTGYEGEGVSEFVEKLQDVRVSLLIDVRERPLSRKEGFSKNALRGNLEEADIKYKHFGNLGSPRQIRSNLKENGDYLTFFKEYRRYIKKQAASVAKIAETATRERVCLMCFEKNYATCHRTIIADEILKRSPQTEIIPL
jgi:uncharacterized protein (DUF488 family)